MTVQINCKDQQVHLSIDGDIYDEDAQCLHDMVNSQVQRGIKELDITLDTTYYISKNGRQYLQKINDMLATKGIKLSFSSHFPSIALGKNS